MTKRLRLALEIVETNDNGEAELRQRVARSLADVQWVDEVAADFACRLPIEFEWVRTAVEELGRPGFLQPILASLLELDHNPDKRDAWVRVMDFSKECGVALEVDDPETVVARNRVEKALRNLLSRDHIRKELAEGEQEVSGADPRSKDG